jgi:putative peptidoglycan lipid II flippase
MFFSGGKPQDGVMLAQTLTILALSTPFMSANFMMSRVFYANEDARTPFYIQLMLALLNVVGAFIIQFLPVARIIFAIAVLYTLGNILSVVISVWFLRRLLGHLDGPRIANSYIRMGYAALGSAITGALALWLLGSYKADGFAWSSRPAALVTVIVVGPVMLLAYLFLLRVFRVSELHDLLRPLLGRLGRGVPVAQVPSASGKRTPTAVRATVSDDTGLIPRISGEFDAASFRAGPALEALPPKDGWDADHDPGRIADGAVADGKDKVDAWSDIEKSYLPDEDIPSTAQGGVGRPDIPLPGRRTYQGTLGNNPYFRGGPRRKR